MMWKTMISTLALIGLGFGAHAQEATPQKWVLPVCNLDSSDYLYWDTLGENVILHTKMITEEGYLPSATLTLEMADGEKITLGGGGKYYDDYEPSNPPSCAEHMDAAKNATLDSIDPTYRKTDAPGLYDDTKYRSMSALQADLRLAGICEVEKLDGPESFKCRQAKYLLERVEENRGELSKTDFDRLVTLNAPVLDITYSTYGNETYVFDPKTRKLTALYYSGC